MLFNNLNEDFIFSCFPCHTSQGQCFIAIDPTVFAPGFDGRLDELLTMQRDLEPTDPERPVLVAGDPERAHMKKCDEIGGIPYPRQVVEHMVSVKQKWARASLGFVARSRCSGVLI